MERRDIPVATPPWTLMRAQQLREGRHLPLLRAHRPGGAFQHARHVKKRRFSLVLLPRTTPWAASSSDALKHVFGNDDRGAQALALFQAALKPGTLKNHGSNLSDFLEFCELYAIAPLDVSPVDIARYIS